jgi:hypothetical protein
MHNYKFSNETNKSQIINKTTPKEGIQEIENIKNKAGNVSCRTLQFKFQNTDLKKILQDIFRGDFG